MSATPWMLPLLSGAALAARLSLGLVLVYSGLQKLRLPYDFLSTVYAYEMVGPTAGLLVAAGMPWIEIVVGLALLGGIALAGAFGASVLLFSVFAVVQVHALSHELEVDCGCFGVGGGTSIVSSGTLLRALICLGAALVGWTSTVLVGDRGVNPGTGGGETATDRAALAATS